jgi:hypothetical protein
MKKLILCLTLTSLVFSQDVEDGQIDQTTTPTYTEETAPPPPLKKNSTEMKNWLFAAGALVSASLAIAAVWINPGSPP